MLEQADAREIQLRAFRADVLEGLSKPQKMVPSRWLYDDRGSELFEAITQLDDYYPTRVETGLLHSRAGEIARFCGPGTTLIEYGAGAGVKTEILLQALAEPALYVPVDIAGDFLKASTGRIAERFPEIPVRPVTADFTEDFDLPGDIPSDGRRSGFFPGSTIGNLGDAEAKDFLSRMRRHVGAGGKAVIGVDLRKDIEVLLAAYDDTEGVTAAFDLNVLHRINRELGGTFPVGRFVHEARWNAEESAVEMHLRSLDDRSVTVDGATFSFAAGETIHTESSRKYSEEGFAELASVSGWKVAAVWQDPAAMFAIMGMESLA